MKENIKLERSLLTSFLLNVDKALNNTYPSNKANVLNALVQIKKIQSIIKEQDADDTKKNKFKQLNLL